MSENAKDAPTEVSGRGRTEPRVEPGSLDLVIELPVRVSVEVGRKRLSLREVLSIGEGSVIELDRDADAAADVLVNGRLIARGDITSVDERLAVRIVEVLQPDRTRGDD